MTFTAADGTALACRGAGTGRPLVCLPGGPMQAAAYLGELGGLSAHRELVLLDLRGTGASQRPVDAATYRYDRQVEDVEAVRAHLGRERIDLLAHSAGASVALSYAARHPRRVERLLLVAPSPLAVGVAVPDSARQQVAELRRTEPWYPGAAAALGRIRAGEAGGADWAAITPLTYGRWDDAARAHAAAGDAQKNTEAAAAYYAPGAPDPAATRSALRALDAPVLVLAGEYDVALPPAVAAEFAALFPRAHLVVQPGAGHFPWLDDAARFVRTAAEFLG